jgi:hypothetical protein
MHKRTFTVLRINCIVKYSKMLNETLNFTAQAMIYSGGETRWVGHFFFWLFLIQCAIITCSALVCCYVMCISCCECRVHRAWEREQRVNVTDSSFVGTRFAASISSAVATAATAGIGVNNERHFFFCCCLNESRATFRQCISMLVQQPEQS